MSQTDSLTDEAVPPSQNQAWCPHATSSKMGDLTEAMQQGVSCAQQSVKNVRGEVCDLHPLPFALLPEMQEL